MFVDVAMRCTNACVSFLLLASKASIPCVTNICLALISIDHYIFSSHLENRLYYSNQNYGIYSSDLLGNDVRQELHEYGKAVGGIAVDEDFVYWSSSWGDSSSPSRQGKIGKLGNPLYLLKTICSKKSVIAW